MNTTTFSRKTIAIALAAGMTLGAVTVPQFAGVQGMSAVAGAAEGDQVIDGITYTAPHRFSAEEVKDHLQIITQDDVNITNKTDQAFKVIPGENDKVLPNGDVKVPHGTWVREEAEAIGGNPTVTFVFKPDSNTPLTPAQEIASAIIVESFGYTGAFVPSTDPRRRTSLLSKAAPGQKGSWIDVSKVIPRGFEFEVTVDGRDDSSAIDPAGDWEYDKNNGRFRFIPSSNAPAATTHNQRLRVTDPSKEHGAQHGHLYILGYQKQPESSSYNIELKFGKDGVARSKPVDLRFIERIKGVTKEEYGKLSRVSQMIVDNVKTEPQFFLGDLPKGSTVEKNLDFGGEFINQLGMAATVPGQGKWGVEEQDDRSFVFTFTPENNTVKSGSVNYRGFNVDIAAAAHMSYMGNARNPLTDYRKQLEKDALWDKGTLFYKIVDDFSENPVEEIENPTQDIYVSDVKKVGDKYEITRNDGKKWTIDLADLNKRITDLENKDTVSPEDFKKVQDDLKKAQDGINGLNGKDAEINKELDKLRNDLNDLNPRVDKLEKRVDKLEGLVIKEVRDNKDGTYTLIRNDNTEVKGNIDVGDNITKIVDNGDGSITITRGDGSTQKVNLSQTVVTETNKGKPGHTITITTPDGNKVTFNAFDVYVTDVKKNAKGDYDIYRSDVNDGKTVWKTIVLSDIRGKITKLEGDLSKLTEKQAKDVEDIKNQIAGLEKEIESLQGSKDDLDKRVTTLETKVSALTLRVTNLEKRVKGLEETDAAWAKCYAGIGATGVPMLMALPLALMSDLNIPGLSELNTQIQRTIGIYNPEAAKWMAENRGLFSAATGVLTAAGVLGMLIHTAKECQPYNKTPGVQDNMNPIIEGSSKIAEKIESGSSKPKDKDKDKDKGSSVDAGSSTGDGSSTEAGSSTAEDK